MFRNPPELRTLNHYGERELVLVGNQCFPISMCRFLSARRGRQAGDKARAYDWAVEKEGGREF